MLFLPLLSFYLVSLSLLPRYASAYGPSSSGPVLHGTQGSRSPLVNWYLHELGVPYQMAPPRPSPHPFGQVPCLTDDEGDVVSFESGAILLYLADKYDPRCATAEDRSRSTPWVVWANSCLDGVCFKEDDRGRVIGTSLDAPNRYTSVLESVMSTRDWILDTDEPSVADVAIASYLCYVPLFNPGVDLSNLPNCARYMKRCAGREQFRDAFGEGHADLVIRECEKYLEGKPPGLPNPFKMFQ
mmetsp:Transcript_15474/g.30873  ORF Transcript_15474/g.30873 Transcript_15474/m.30873 type:complete len:242 (+) Transcript_15474:174-899(+)|eukprot:CAMPEP_0182456238 /NCGR_PEP_ID=MMETSP1319-20130603/2131_1 /TAXON_ID=172717 /ORGANISM="Bolidomonas pacifica, Strain RCC208" /LENGTH=241 /DNA_ID=CAMNT_0024654429 /DNA_START=174 /DNA_END=899 /DNA_ORIENTATION=-